MPSRTATAVAGIAGSLLISAVLWLAFDSFVFFLFVPFVPFLFRGSSRASTGQDLAECPECGFRTADDAYQYCPRDGARLE